MALTWKPPATDSVWSPPQADTPEADPWDAMSSLVQQANPLRATPKPATGKLLYYETSKGKAKRVKDPMTGQDFYEGSGDDGDFYMPADQFPDAKPVFAEGQSQPKDDESLQTLSQAPLDANWAESIIGGVALGTERVANTADMLAASIAGKSPFTGATPLEAATRKSRFIPLKSETPLTLDDVLNRPGDAWLKALNITGQGVPMIGGAMAGGPAGAAAAVVMQEMQPRLAEAIERHPNDMDAAWEEAAKMTALSSGVAAAGIKLVQGTPFEGQIKNALFQALGVQPALGQLQRLGEAGIRGEKYDVSPKALADSYVQDTVSGFPMLAPELLAKGRDAFKAKQRGRQTPPATEILPPQPDPSNSPLEPAAAAPRSVADYVKGVEESDIGVPAWRPPDDDLGVTRPPQADDLSTLLDEPVQAVEQTRPPQAAKPSTPWAPPKSDPLDTSMAERAGVSFFRPEELAVDAKRFQFKEGGDEYGVSDRLRGVTKWDPKLAGQVMAWQDAKGQKFVVDGHQRAGLARRIKAQGDGQDIVLAGQLLREADGITADDAMAIAAKKNMAEGTGSPVDAAKVLRLRPDMLDDPSMPFSGRNMRIAKDLVPLKTEAFGMVINKIVPEDQAAIVGRLIPDDGPMQTSAMGLLARLEPSNATEAESIIRQAMDAGASREVQTGLFGDEVVANSYFGERAKVLSKTLQKLGRDRRVFGTLVDEADSITGAGNKLDTASNENIAKLAETARAVLIKAANKKGPLSDALTQAAKRARDTGRFEAPVNEFAAEVRRAVESGQLDRDPDGANVRAKPGAADDVADGLGPTMLSVGKPSVQWDAYRHPETGMSLVEAERVARAMPSTLQKDSPERARLRIGHCNEICTARGGARQDREVNAAP
jgi:hypothetical protein